MSLVDRATGLKTCEGPCGETKTAEGNFFHVSSCKDGYARKCKKCYYIKADPSTKPVKAEKPSKPASAEGTGGDDAAPAVERKIYTHTDAEIRAIEKRDGVEFKEWMHDGYAFVPVFMQTHKEKKGDAAKR